MVRVHERALARVWLLSPKNCCRLKKLVFSPPNKFFIYLRPIFFTLNLICMNIYKTIFLPGKHYHVYNHAISQELLFKDLQNYPYFVRRMFDHLEKYVEVNAYCLMPNHYHLLIRVRKFSSDEVHVHNTILQAFSNFQNGYAKAINKRYFRKGRLFQSSVCRVHLGDEQDIVRIKAYIRQNPVDHGFCTSPENWPHMWFRQERKAA